MKKLIMSAITAAALLFGFASCAGDLHDKEYYPIDLTGYVISGGWNTWTGNLVEGLSGTNAVYDNVKPSDDGDYLVFCPNDGKNNYIKSLSKGTLPEGMDIDGIDDGFGGKNPIIKGFKKGYTYKISLDTSKGLAEVSVEITDSPVPTPENLPDTSKLILVIGTFGETPVEWKGNLGTAIVKKGTALTGWGDGKFEGALVEDSSWTGKFCGVTLDSPGEVKTLVSDSSNLIISEFAGKATAEKNIILTFKFIPEGTWDGAANGFTSKATITVSYSLSD